MAEEVKYSKLKAYLEALPKNTAETPYEITIVGYKAKTLKALLKIIQDYARFVDLSSTELDGLEDISCGFCPPGIGYRVSYLVGAPKFTNYTGTSAESLFNYCENLKKVDLTGLENITNAKAMFWCCKNLTSIDTSALKNVKNAQQMFSGCTGLTSIDTSPFTNLTNAFNMFEQCTGLTKIDTSAFTNVTDARAMFVRCSDLTSVDTSAFTNVTKAMSMFKECNNLDEASKKSVEEFMSHFDEKGNRIE